MCLSSLNELDRGEVMDDLSREAARAGKRVWHAPAELSTLDITEPDALPNNNAGSPLRASQDCA